MSNLSQNDAVVDKPMIELPRKKIIFYMAILYLLFVSDYWARLGINALLPLIQNDLKLNDAQIGMIGSAVLVGMMAFVLPLSYLADKWSKRGTICIMGVTWSVGTILCGLIPSFLPLMAGRFLVGAGNSSYAPASVSTFTSWFPKKRWGQVIGIYNTSITLGFAGGIFLTGMLATYFHWKVVFLIIGIPSIILSFMALLLPKTEKIVETAENKVSVKEALKVIFTTRSLMFASLGTTSFNFAGTAWITFGTIFFVREMGMGIGEAASILALTGIVGVISGPLGGFLVDKWYSRDIRARGFFPMLCLIATGIIMIVGIKMRSIPIIILGNFTLAMVPACYHVISQEIVPSRYRASSYGALVIFLQFGGVLGGVTTGVLSDIYGVQLALMIMCVGYFISALCFLGAALFYCGDFECLQASE